MTNSSLPWPVVKAGLEKAGVDPAKLADNTAGWLCRKTATELVLILDDVRLGTDNFDWEEASQSERGHFMALKKASR